MLMKLTAQVGLLSLILCFLQTRGLINDRALVTIRLPITVGVNSLFAVKSIESTPNPSAFKLNLDYQILPGAGQTFTKSHEKECPHSVSKILANHGIESVYAMSDWVCVNKFPSDSHSWDELLPLCVEALGGAVESSDASACLNLLEAPKQHLNNSSIADEQLSVTIRMQSSNGIPIQVEATSGLTTKRQALSPRFVSAMNAFITKDDENETSKGSRMKFFEGRSWIFRGILYAPTLEEALSSAVSDLEAVYSHERLQSLVTGIPEMSLFTASTPNLLNLRSLNDKVAILAVEQLCSLTDGLCVSESHDNSSYKEMEKSALISLTEFVRDGVGSVSARRFAIAYLGSCSRATLPSSPMAQYKNLIFFSLSRAFSQEKAAGLRRTAGDALSDFGDNRAVPVAAHQLKVDPSKLVRWRAARILGELGVECSRDVISGAVGALKAANLVEGQTFEVLFECRNSLALLRDGNDNESGTREESNISMSEWIRMSKNKEL